MLEHTGDLWDYVADATVITTNGSVNRRGQAVMGRGVALQAALRYPSLRYALAAKIRISGNHVHLIGMVDKTVRGGIRNIVALPVKMRWWEHASRTLLTQSCTELVDLTDKLGWRTVALPRPGCGNGGLDWADVRPLIEPILDDRFVVVNQ